MVFRHKFCQLHLNILSASAEFMYTVSAFVMMLLLACNMAVRIGLKNRVAPATRDKIFGAAVLTALAHAGYVRPCAHNAMCLLGSSLHLGRTTVTIV